MSFFGSIISAGASHLNTNAALTADWYNTKETNDSNEHIANKANAWSERMSNTAYQRSMADMKEAGLNPILAYKQGGAGTPSVQTYTAQKPNTGEILMQGGNSALDAFKKGIEFKSMDAAMKKIKQETKVADLSEKLLREDWIRKQMYNRLVLPTELASAKEGFNASYYDSANSSSMSKFINKYKPDILDTSSKGIDSFLKSFRSNFNSAYDSYFGR